MPDIRIRPATAADQDLIREMVRDAELDPTSLRWPQFLIAEIDGDIVGIGQVRPYPTCRELGSLVVKRPFRDQGIGSALVNALLSQERGDVYLECEAANETYYARFGFQRLPWWRAPLPLNLKAGAANILGRFYGFRVVTMRRAAPKQ